MDFSDESVQDAVNYCRNPDPTLRTEGPWCFTTEQDLVWDYCNVPFCDGPFVVNTFTDLCIFISFSLSRPKPKLTIGNMRMRT